MTECDECYRVGTQSWRVLRRSHEGRWFVHVVHLCYKHVRARRRAERDLGNDLADLLACAALGRDLERRLNG